MMRPARDPTTGPYVTFDDVEPFKQFCAANDYSVRPSKGAASDFDVRYDGHWMCVKRNKVTERMTADRRLAPLVHKFVHRKK